MGKGFEETTDGAQPVRLQSFSERLGALVGSLFLLSIPLVILTIYAGFMLDALDWAWNLGRSIIG